MDTWELFILIAGSFLFGCVATCLFIKWENTIPDMLDGETEAQALSRTARENEERRTKQIADRIFKEGV
jgi:hypothetical protein